MVRDLARGAVVLCMLLAVGCAASPVETRPTLTAGGTPRSALTSTTTASPYLAGPPGKDLYKISANGRFVYGGIAYGGDPRPEIAPFVWDRSLDIVTKFPTDATGVDLLTLDVSVIWVSNTGEVLFSTDRRLIESDVGGEDLYLYSSGTYRLVTPGSSMPKPDWGAVDASQDGRFVVLIGRDYVGQYAYEIFVLDTASGAITVMPNGVDGQRPWRPGGNPGSDYVKIGGISDDGRFVAFTSFAANLVAGDDNGISDLFIWNLATGLYERGPQPLAPPGYGISAGDISADGSRVAVLVDPMYVRLDAGLYSWTPAIWDRSNRTLTAAPNDTLGGPSAALALRISADGSKVVFSSNDRWIVSGSGPIDRNVFLWDTIADRIERQPPGVGGQEVFRAFFTDITPDASEILVLSDENLVEGATDSGAYIWTPSLAGECNSVTADRNCDGVVRTAVLGDSYIAGEGANQRSRYLGCTNAYRFDCDRNQDNQLTDADRVDPVQLDKFKSFAGQTGFSGNNCHRSSGSWGWQIADSVSTAPSLQNVLFAACSGAESKHVYEEAQYPDSPGFLAGGEAQVGHLREFGATDVVFVSLGGNDFGFADVVGSCIPYRRCGGSDDNRTRWLQQVTGRRANLVEALEEVKAAAPHATVYVSNYPLVVSAQSSCPVSGDLTWMRTVYLPAVNAAVAQAALQAGVRTVDLTGTNGQADVQLGNVFAGREVCTQTSWVNGLSRGEEVGPTATTGVIGSESFHPTVDGHDAIRNAVRTQLIDTGRIGTLGNPTPVDQGIPPANGLPREVATFEIAPTGLQQDAFHGSVAGAPPGTDLTIRLHSEPLDLAHVRTDASGQWQGVVDLPSWASSGLHELEILEDASGVTLWRGVAFVGQAPSTEPDSATTYEGQPVVLDVLANDSDTDTPRAELRLGAVEAVHGSMGIIDGRMRYTPPAGFVGQDTGTYELCDEAEPCVRGTFTVEVLPVQVEGLQVSFEATGRRLWSGAGVVGTNELRVVRTPDGKLASVRGSVTVPGGAGDRYRVQLDVSNVLFWSFGSISATDVRTGKLVATFLLFAQPLAETEQDGVRSLVVTGAGLQFYRGTAYPSSLTVTVQSPVG